MTRVAAIDVGTNSVRTTVVETSPADPYRVVDDEKAYTRLGQGRDAEGRLAPEAMERTTAALARMLDIVRRLQAGTVIAVATAAVREAPNGPEYVARVREELGLDLRILSGEEEARLAFVAAAESFPLTGRAAVVDVGGGSVEVVVATSGQIESVTSLPFGAITLSERFVDRDPLPEDSYRRLRRFVRKELRGSLGKAEPPVTVMVGSGGTVNALASMIAARNDDGGPSVHGYELARRDVMHTLGLLRRTTQAERTRIQGLPPQRADIILPGAVAVSEVMRHFQANTMWVNGRGIREGLVLDHLRGSTPASDPADPIAAAERFAARCDWEEGHARAVCALAESMFDQLAGPLGLDAQNRRLLHVAALLHDVGYFISYEQHHKHSYHLIIHSALPGLTRRELAIVAAVARYHRGALPKSKHEALAGLDRADRRAVMRLAALVRLADGLDRTRDQQVTSVEVTVGTDAVRVAVRGDGPLDAVLHGASEKSDLFEVAFGLPVEVVAG